MICVKMHRAPDGRTVLAACDDVCIGAEYSEGKIRLKVIESFYRDEVVTESVFVSMMREADIMNLVGGRAVELAISEGYVDGSYVMTIDGTPHAQVVKG